MEQKEISAEKVLFIKLGSRGDWEGNCIKNGKMRFGYGNIPHEICEGRDWNQAASLLAKSSKSKGAATRHLNQICHFYEFDDKVLWITFYKDRLWWCFTNSEVERLPDGDRQRSVRGKWSDESVGGRCLLKGTLSGKLLALQGYRGTICSVKETKYLLHKINDTVPPHIEEVSTAFEALETALIPLIKMLHPRDLEILTDLIFQQGGWQRTGVLGGTEKDIDLDLTSPITNERIAVQVKSKATKQLYEKYAEIYSEMRGFTRFYFVAHSPDDALERAAREVDDDNFVFWGDRDLARQVVRSGLTGWLMDKAI